MTATPKAPGAVRVKPLEWRHYARDETYPEAWTADCLGGFYTVLKDDEDAFRMLTTSGKEYEGYTFQSEAIEAAQCDYEARILSALEPAPDAIRAAALEEAAFRAGMKAAENICRAAAQSVTARGINWAHNCAVFIAMNEVELSPAAIRALITTQEPTP